MRTSETTQIIQGEFNKAYKIWSNTKAERDELVAKRRTLESKLKNDNRTI